jgi:ketosteroid isomerase-like protein
MTRDVSFQNRTSQLPLHLACLSARCPLANSQFFSLFIFLQIDQYDRGTLKAIPILLLLAAAILAQDSAPDGAQVWNLEKAYWEYVKTNDLEKYRALWHEDFLGWPFVSSAPVRKDHITDWITANTSKGVKLQSYSIEQLAIQVTGDVAINHYRIKADWATSEGVEVRKDTLRITHTWIRTQGTWQILGGMSAPVNSEGK